jgi:nitroimidazol reductase NimA-like FMN-containing flavoprotein (pyridoxamine 5'-phosphate oxidase superfamily)
MASSDDARSIVDANSYMTLATADADGRPWASPVWFATRDQREFIWASRPEARHSLNIASRPEVAIVIFDSHVPPGRGAAVYMSARAEQLEGVDAARGLEIFSAECLAQGLPAWLPEQIAPGARHRLYRARAAEQYVLNDRDERVPVEL